MRRLLRWILHFTAVAYPVAIAGIVAAMALIGEQWWPTTVALYLPRALFAAPLPLIALALLVWGPRWLLVAQAVAAALILFPLMGLQLGGRVAEASGARLRVLSYNVDFGTGSRRDVREEIARARADVVLVQGSDQRIFEKLGETLHDMETRRAGEFFVASRYPIVDFYDPPAIDGAFSAGFVRVTLDTPLGPVDVYSVHPASPRSGFKAMAGDELKERLTSGRLIAGEGSDQLMRNTARRRRQVAALAEHASGALHPVIIAGDTNLPGLSPIFREHLGGYQDGFAEVGRGFGYTFPAHTWVPWMRIDRVLASQELVFLGFEVGSGRGSDHLCVVADLARR